MDLPPTPFRASALSRRPRLLVSSSVRWNYLWQRHHALARAAAADGWEVDFLQPRPRTVRQLATYPLRRATGAVLSQEPPQVPGVRVRPTGDWLRLMRSPEPYDLALVYLPDRITEALLARLHPAGVVYDAVLDWSAVPAGWFPPTGWRAAEQRLAARADTRVTTDSEGMREVLAARGIAATTVHPAADDEFLAGPVPAFAGRARRALYFGSVRAEVDTGVLTALAGAGVGVDVVGRVEDAAAEAELVAAGIVIRPAVPIAELPALVRGYRIVLLPYRGARASTLLPAKYWNCMASGSWVVTSGLRAVSSAASAERGAHAGGAPRVVAWEELGAAGVTALLDRAPGGVADPPGWPDRWSELSGLATAVGARS